MKGKIEKDIDSSDCVLGVTDDATDAHLGPWRHIYTSSRDVEGHTAQIWIEV